MAGDLYGGPDGRPPLVLLNGLTYARGIWQPVLSHLGRIDPGRQVLNLDLPGHGDSPDQFPHTLEHVVPLVRDAIGEAGLGTPVLVGHSMSGGIASLYAAQYPLAASSTWTPRPTSGRSSSCCGRWPTRTMATCSGRGRRWSRDSASTCCRLRRASSSRAAAGPGPSFSPATGKSCSRWHRIRHRLWWAARSPRSAPLKVPYLLILGTEMSPGTAAWFRNAAPQAVAEVWAGSGHFPHLAHPARFAERLAATA